MGRSNGPVDLQRWLEANQPQLHPTRRKVLAAVAELGSGQAEVTSSQVRKVVGISQQLLNRHLRGLESQGLVELEHRGPGLPLVVRITSAGLRALERRRPHSEPVTEAQVAPSPSVRQAPPPAARSPLLSPRLERFARSLYRALDAYLPGLGWEDFLALVAPALKRRPLAMALYEALEPHLARGMSLELFTQVLREVARRLKEAGTPRGRPAVRRPKPAVSEGPPLGPAEAALERRLEQTMNPRYRGMPWYQRTRELSNEWDRARRRHLGLFSTAFDSFRPRWERPDWDDFNQARRQADARGALYSDWVQAQFERLAALGEDHVPPSQLHGQEAIEAWQERFGVEEGEAAPLGPAPYTIDTFRLDDPQHVAYAERVIREIEELARRVLGGEDETVVRLLVEAVSAGNLPAAALELAPRYKEQVLADLARRQAKASRRAPAASSISGSTPRTRIII